MPKQHSGHRERLRESFITAEESAMTDEALLELLLTYAIPLVDVAPLAQRLLQEFGSLAGVLKADYEQLCLVSGVKAYTAVLLKVVQQIKSSILITQHENMDEVAESQLALFNEMQDVATRGNFVSTMPVKYPTQQPRKGSDLFGKAVLKEAIRILPLLPETELLDVVREFLHNNLGFSSEGTRKRYTSYVTRRMFPDGYADAAIRTFARRFAGTQALNEVCFYRFCKAEPVMLDVTEHVLLPALASGAIARPHIRAFLERRYPGAKVIPDCVGAIIEALGAAEIAVVDQQAIMVSYREITPQAFAFIVHNEFPEPGMFNIDLLMENRAIKAMLWNPDRLLPSLYDLRNRGLISKVSEIDAFRQFTTQYTLEELVNHLVVDGAGE